MAYAIGSEIGWNHTTQPATGALVPNPNACRWCGIDQRHHGRQYTNTAGWHTWGQLVASQIRTRLLARHKRTTAT